MARPIAGSEATAGRSSIRRADRRSDAVASDRPSLARCRRIATRRCSPVTRAAGIARVQNASRATERASRPHRELTPAPVECSPFVGGAPRLRDGVEASRDTLRRIAVDRAERLLVPGCAPGRRRELVGEHCGKHLGSVRVPDAAPGRLVKWNQPVSVSLVFVSPGRVHDTAPRRHRLVQGGCLKTDHDIGRDDQRACVGILIGDGQAPPHGRAGCPLPGARSRRDDPAAGGI